MSQIPHSQSVQKSIKSVENSCKKALKGINQKAGLLMSRGKYEDAQIMAEKGRSIQQFIAEVETLKDKWKDLSRSSVKKIKKEHLPQWEYYQPILKALVQLGGEANSTELEPVLEKLLIDKLKNEDRHKNPKGVEYWKTIAKKSRKHLVAEAWLENTKGTIWKITQKGRQTSLVK